MKDVNHFSAAVASGEPLPIRNTRYRYVIRPQQPRNHLDVFKHCNKAWKAFGVLNNEKKCIATLNMCWFYVNKLNRYILYIEIFGDPPLTRAGKMETVHWCTRRRAGTNKTGAKARENIQCKIGIRFVHLWPYGSIHYFEWLLMVIYPVLVT